MRLILVRHEETVNNAKALCWLLEIYVLECNVLRLIERAFVLIHTTGMYNQCGSFSVYAQNTHLFL